ncbi:MAG: response regulator transcription factor, partial [Eubacterium sp.]|nr:response regulator transcription factor [Eubacterium sp.]
MSKILIVEDEESIADLEKDYLELSGFEVVIENQGDRGLARALTEEYDLFILDLMLPGVDGFEICKQIREKKNTPIIIVSAKKDDIDKIRGLGLGADDYMVKPFNPLEAVARVNSCLRRVRGTMARSQAQTVPSRALRCRDLDLDVDACLLTRAGEPIDLTPVELR